MIIPNIIKKLMPKNGMLWQFLSGSFADRLTTGLSVEPLRIKAFLKTIVRESNPGTAIATQEDWYQQYGIKYNPTKPIKAKQAETLQRYVQLGGQDIIYFQRHVYLAGFDNITIVENRLTTDGFSSECGAAICGASVCTSPGILGEDWIFYFYVIGSVLNADEEIRLTALVQRLSPGHCIPIYVVTLEDVDNVCNSAICGLSVCEGTPPTAGEWDQEDGGSWTQEDGSEWTQEG